MYCVEFFFNKTTFDDSFVRISVLCFYLKVYNKALLIHADARIKDASAILEEFMEEERVITPKNKTDVMLLELYDSMFLQSFTLYRL